MLYNLATVNDDIARFDGQEVTVRCRITGDAHRGYTGGEKVLYEVTDPTGNLELQTLISFWLEEPSGGPFDDIRKTESYILDVLSGAGSDAPDLPRGETLLVRGIPKIASHRNGRQLFINVTSVVIREPDLRIGKSELRTQEACPRRYYLRYVKKVYGGSSSVNKYRFRGNAVHLSLERALEEDQTRFAENAWTSTEAAALAERVMDEELGLAQAKLSISGQGLSIKSDVEEIVSRLFTDSKFCESLSDADEIVPEQPLPEQYGYNGTVDIVVDGIPYDLKTTWQLDAQKREKHSRQLRLYLFTLLLERLEPDENLFDAIDDDYRGYLVYPNLEDADTVSIKEVTLTVDDIAELVGARNEVAKTRSTFGPPSPYNRDCEGCRYQHDQSVSATGETLPPACTFHCQNERRWPCYEYDEERGVDSDCSLFDSCEQRLEYRDPDETDHYNALRSALQSERKARDTANDLMDGVDRTILKESGRLLTGLKIAGGSNVGLHYETDQPIVPAFSPGESVQIEPVQTGVEKKTVTYLGRKDGAFVFGFDTIDPAFMDEDREYRVRYGFNPDIVSRRYLPYLDYAQRRESNPRFEYDETGGSDGSTRVESTSAILDELDNEEVFVDLPTRTDRTPVLAGLIGALASGSYPKPTGEGETVSESASRALVLGQTPEHVELAHEATPDGSHYRMDGFARGPDTIHGGLDRQTVEERLLGSRSLISTVEYALDTGHFHELEEGGFGDRDHSENFFDVVVLFDAEQITEPVYLYLRDVADRVVAIGDSRRQGPDMVSTDAIDRGLDRSYFEWAHERYATVPVAEVASLQFGGHGNGFVRKLFDDDLFDAIDAELSFFGIHGTEATETEEMRLTVSLRARNGIGHDLEFDVSHTSVNPFEIQEAFADREYLDATNFPSEGSVLVDGYPLQLVEKRPLENVENAEFHRITITADPNAIPAFSQTFLRNRPEASIVCQLVDDYDPDCIVTPFEAHANELQRQLTTRDIDVPVRLPKDLNGDIADRAIVSFAAANEAGILHPPLTDPDTLYSLLTCARDILMVGDKQTLTSKDGVEFLVDQLAEEYELE
ncbi:PD-(D/E)XK nuclease family protein [Halosimplex sp. TS25]|uniref:PD-(D/E)XK nuclease family protein n=1 Tax=Halosimplex rarum TaxID=3396619 RepID=UPI0039EC39EF